MKQIKFRGRNIKTGIFHFGFYSEYPIGNGRIEYCITDKNLECWAVEPDSVAQLVGYDKNGKEIYEGDKLLDYDSETVVAGLIPFFRFEDVNNAGVYPVGYRFDIFTLKESQDETN